MSDSMVKHSCKNVLFLPTELSVIITEMIIIVTVRTRTIIMLELYLSVVVVYG